MVVEYTYDAWGKVLSTTGSMAGTLGTIQPFRYRGYVYDVETGLYYLKSRYYNPETGRLINKDSIFDGKNLFSYCNNNPLLGYDPDGQSFVLTIVALFGAIGGVLYYDYHIEKMPGVNAVEKQYIKNHPIEAYRAKKLSQVASDLTDYYWGDGASDVDVTYANAFKHAVWCALMAREFGSQTAFDISTSHEYWDYNDPGKYEPYGTNVTTTLAQATKMDLANNAQGIEMAKTIPFYFSDEEVAKVIIEDMKIHINKYQAIETQVYNRPIRGW